MAMDAREPMGGDPPCWAHLFEEDPNVLVDPERAQVANLAAMARSVTGSGPAWTLASEDLNLNFLVFFEGEGIDEHVNTEVDVLFVGVSGEGTVSVDGTQLALRAGRAILAPKGVRRSTRATGERFAYLTCHRCRGGLLPGKPG
jgi:mannose-6-phosphate isomerase-like protein (cupin superfamily)